jgi:predicted transcriptional regulator
MFKIDADIADRLRELAKSRHISSEKFLEQLIVKNLDRLSSGRRAAL